jgi:hypothetical protein
MSGKRKPPDHCEMAGRFVRIERKALRTRYCDTSLRSHRTPSAETSRYGTRDSSRHGLTDASYSTTSYNRPHVRQLIQSATFGGSSQGSTALRFSSATAWANDGNSPSWGSACRSSSMMNIVRRWSFQGRRSVWPPRPPPRSIRRFDGRERHSVEIEQQGLVLYPLTGQPPGPQLAARGPDEPLSVHLCPLPVRARDRTTGRRVDE